MSAFKGTPNGWKLRNERHENIQYVNGGVNHSIYKADIQANLTNRNVVEVRGAAQFENELRSNAHLIAAAPDLLEALITAQQHLALLKSRITNEKILFGINLSIEQSTEAINKALGKEETHA